MFWERKAAPGAARGAVNRPPSNALRTLRRAFSLLCLFTLLVGAAAGCGRSQSAADTETQDSYQVSFGTEPAAASQGDAVIVIAVKDQTGRPVDGAAVAIEANMNHAGMTPENADTTASEGGIYRLPLTWTMGGAWFVDVQITLPGGEVIRRRFPVDVK